MDFDQLAPLTNDELAQLEGQGDRIAQLLGSLDAMLVDNNVRMAQAIATFGQARLELDALKQEKSMIVERARLLKGLLLMFPRATGSFSL